MKLTKEEKAMLGGDRGEAVKKAMEILVALGNIYGARDLVPVTSVQISGVSYKNLGEAGLEFLGEWADQGARVIVPTTLNPAGMDLDEWEKIGFDQDFAKKQKRVIEVFGRMAIPPYCSCTPYLVGPSPRFGDHIGWAESSAVSFANSVLGARTNREGGPSALAAAITGRTARYGYHLKKNRLADYVIEVKVPLKDTADFGALGYLVGRALKNKVPCFRGIPFATTDQLKSLGASMAAWGAVALYHIEGITPEAQGKLPLKKEINTITLDSLKAGYDKMNSSVTDIDFVGIGCPHASLDEIKTVADRVRGKKLKATLWVTTALQTKTLAARMGLVKDIEAAGGYVLADTCMVVAPVQSFGFKNIALNSGKGAHYVPGHCKLNARFGSLEKCLQAAETGRWQE